MIARAFPVAAGFLLSFMVALPAHARVFSFQDSWIAAYFRGTGGLSNLGHDAVANTSGDDTAFSDDVPYNFSGEIGFAFLLSDKAVLRLGAEAVRGKVDAIGSRASDGVKYLDVESDVSGFNPNLTFEYNFRNTGTSRLFAFLGVGSAIVKVANDYTLTATAVTDYGATEASYKESWLGEALSYHAGAGWEMFLMDNVTFTLEAGWRMFEVDKFEYNSTSQALRGGAQSSVAEGATVTDNLGRKVGLDLGGAFVGVAFRFYIPPLD